MPNENFVISPLRYPGSKASLTGYVAEVIHANHLSGCTIYEPYAGSAIISLEMLFRGFAKKAVIVERDPLLYSFWDSVFNNCDELIKAIQETDVSIETWSELRKYRTATSLEYPTLELGFAGLFFNRTNFSGILGANPIGGIKQSSKYPISCRFNKTRIINQIIFISQLKDKVELVFDDAIDYLKKNEDSIFKDFSFLYIDPPYYLQGKKLYRYWYEHSDHVRLANYLKSLRVPWLVSYDDNSRIRELYQNSKIQKLYIDYTAKVSKRGEELLISNVVIPPPKYQSENNNIVDVKIVYPLTTVPKFSNETALLGKL